MIYDLIDFPDLNVWVAMTFDGHVHHKAAMTWYYSLDDEEELVFCRFTQLGFLRLLTNAQVMGTSVKTQRQAWETYDAFILEANVRLMQELALLEQRLRAFSSLDSASPQHWADAYLTAFAEQAELRLATFDKALASRSADAILLVA